MKYENLKTNCETWTLFLNQNPMFQNQRKYETTLVQLYILCCVGFGVDLVCWPILDVTRGFGDVVMWWCYVYYLVMIFYTWPLWCIYVFLWWVLIKCFIVLSSFLCRTEVNGVIFLCNHWVLISYILMLSSCLYKTEVIIVTFLL